MHKKFKIIISIIGLVLGLSIIGGTLYIAKTKGSTLSIKESSGERPSMPNGSSGSSNNMGEPPNMNNNSSSDSTSKSNREKPSTNDSSSNSKRTNKDMMQNHKGSLSILYIALISIGSLLFIISLVYLCLSGFGNKLVFTSRNSILIFILINLVLTGVMSFGIVNLSNKYLLTNNNNNNNSAMTPPDNNNQNSTDESSTTTDSSSNL